MNSRSHCAVDIIANCIDVGTKQRGGERLALSLSVWQTLCGARHIRLRENASLGEAFFGISFGGAKKIQRHFAARLRLAQVGRTFVCSAQYFRWSPAPAGCPLER